MSNPFDVTTKQLVEAGPTDWLRYLHLPGTRAELVDADLVTVTTDADRVLRVSGGGFPSYLLHIEFQASRDPTLAARTLRYNVLLFAANQLPVKSVVVLLRRKAQAPNLTGSLRCVDAEGTTYLVFDYVVVRLWEQSVEEILAGGLATLPLALLGKVKRRDVTAVIRRMQARVEQELPSEELGIFGHLPTC